MRLPSFSLLPPKAVRSRLGNSPSESSPIAHHNHNIMQSLTPSNAVPHVSQRRPSGLSLYWLYPASNHASDAEDEEMYQDELSVLEPRPKAALCAGLLGLIED